MIGIGVRCLVTKPYEGICAIPRFHSVMERPRGKCEAGVKPTLCLRWV